MNRAIVRVLLVLFCGTACAQTFEVVSIKPSAPPEMDRMFMGQRGGPGTGDPTRWTTTNLNLSYLVMLAYDLRPYQLSAPEWLNTTRFDIAAKVPEGATKEQFRVMLQNMLAERFKLEVHRENKELPIYELVIGKGGPKFKESADQADTVAPAGPLPPPPGPPKMGRDGFPEMPAGRSGMIVEMGRARLTAYKETMESLARRVSMQVGRPVMDATGLKKKYDFMLTFVPDGGNPSADTESGPTLTTALQEQLGLKLEGKKGPVEIIVVDKMEKVPTEN